MVTDRELWKTMTASEIRAYRKGEKIAKEKADLNKQRSKKAAETKRNNAKPKSPKSIDVKTDKLQKLSANIEVPVEIAEQFKKKLKKDKLSAKDVFDVAVYQYINDELRINTGQARP